MFNVLYCALCFHVMLMTFYKNDFLFLSWNFLKIYLVIQMSCKKHWFHLFLRRSAEALKFMEQNSQKICSVLATSIANLMLVR